MYTSHPDGHRVAELIAVSGHGQRRGSGYLVDGATVLTAAHVVAGATQVTARFDADRVGCWSAGVTVCWSDAEADLAVLRLAPYDVRGGLGRAPFGRAGDGPDAYQVQVVGYPLWKLRRRPDGTSSRESHQATGVVAPLSNRRSDTLEITVGAPAAGDGRSPWEAMSGAVVWAAGRAIGVVTGHFAAEGPGRLTAARIDRYLDRPGPGRVELARLLGIHHLPGPDVTPAAEPRQVSNALSLMQVVVAAVIAVILLVGVSIGYAAWRSPPRTAASGAAPPVGFRSSAPADPGGVTPGAEPVSRPLTDLPPSAGGHRVSRPPGTSGVLEMACATGGNGDRYRTVQYDLLRAYQRFTAAVTRTGSTRSEARAQVEVIVDNVIKDSRIVRLDSGADVSAPVAGANQLELRLTCEEPAGTVTFTDARLTR